jgi:hypothetical protein
LNKNEFKVCGKFVYKSAVFINMFYLNIFKTMKGPGLKPCETPH